ncbi:MAG: ATP-binding protein, partial [Polyangiales bacterium]
DGPAPRARERLRAELRRVFAFAGEGGRLVDVAGPQGPVIDLQSPVRAYLLTGGRAPAAAQVKPGGSVLHGRASELAALHEALAAAIEAKQPVHRLVTGDVGVGKSALLAGFAAEVAGKVRLVRVECGFGSSEEPLSLMAELARALFVLRDDVHGDVLEARVHAGVTQWLQEGPERALVAQVMQSVLGLGLGARSAGAELPRHSVVLAFELLLQAMAIEAPMLLCLDALQWADSSSLEVLAALLGRLQHIPLLTLLGCRPDTNVEARLAAAARLHLGELGDAARRALVHDRLEGAELPRDIEDEVIARAGGNPLFIGELVETLRARQALCIREVDGSRRVTRQALLGMVLPNTLEGLVRVRLMQLIDIQRQALRWLAVAGRGVHAAELSHLAGIALGEALESLEALGWVQRRAAGGYAFLSAVVRHVTYASIDADDRKRMHAVVAQYFRQAGERVAPARCARHLEQAGLPREAARYAIRAAEQARRNYANAEALHFYARALALLPEDAPLRFQAREGRAQILRGMGLRQQEYDELQALSRQAARTGDPAMWATVHNRLARHALDGARTTGVAHHLQAALRAAQSAASAGAEVEALRLSIQLARAEGKPQDALEACDKALATAGLSPDLLAARASVLVQRSLLLQQLLQLDEALRNAVEATVIFCRLGIKRNEAQALTSLGVASALMGQLEDALAALIRSVALDREIGDRFHAGLKL